MGLVITRTVKPGKNKFYTRQNGVKTQFTILELNEYQVKIHIAASDEVFILRNELDDN